MSQPSAPSASSAILRILIRSTGFSVEEIARAAGLSMDSLAGGAVSYGDGMRVWQAIAELAEDPILGHHIGAGLRLHHVGVFGPLVAHSEHVRAGLLATCRAFAVALPEGCLTVDDAPDELVIRYARPSHPVRVRHGVESLFATLVSLAREGSGRDVSPERVELTSPPPPDPRVFEAFYRVPVRFGTAVDRLVFRGEQLDFPMIGDEPALLRVIEERAAEVLSPGDLRERAVQVCRRLFEAQREPTLALAAKDLGLSARTLQRKLAATSVSFRQIRDAAARSVAEQLLRDPERTVEEIAERVGYTSRSAFERAFTRWTGVTPAQWRRDQG